MCQVTFRCTALSCLVLKAMGGTCVRCRKWGMRKRDSVMAHQLSQIMNMSPICCTTCLTSSVDPGKMNLIQSLSFSELSLSKVQTPFPHFVRGAFGTDSNRQLETLLYIREQGKSNGKKAFTCFRVGRRPDSKCPSERITVRASSLLLSCWPSV